MPTLWEERFCLKFLALRFKNFSCKCMLTQKREINSRALIMEARAWKVYEQAEHTVVYTLKLVVSSSPCFFYSHVNASEKISFNALLLIVNNFSTLKMRFLVTAFNQSSPHFCLFSYHCKRLFLLPCSLAAQRVQGIQPPFEYFAVGNADKEEF